MTNVFVAIISIISSAITPPSMTSSAQCLSTLQTPVLHGWKHPVACPGGQQQPQLDACTHCDPLCCQVGGIPSPALEASNPNCASNPNITNYPMRYANALTTGASSCVHVLSCSSAMPQLPHCYCFQCIVPVALQGTSPPRLFVCSARHQPSISLHARQELTACCVARHQPDAPVQRWLCIHQLPDHSPECDGKHVSLPATMYSQPCCCAMHHCSGMSGSNTHSRVHSTCADCAVLAC